MLPDWPQIPLNEETVRASGSLGLNTGMRTANTPVFDIDIPDEETALLVEGIVRRRMEGRGEILLRIGESPKCPIPLRTDAPFKKAFVALTPPPGLGP